jgi:chromosome segregation ATPase
MKGFQENLLVVVALGLCGLCVYQWRGQTLQRNEIESLNQTVSDKSAAIQGYTNSIRTMDHQIAALGTQIAELRQTARTNEMLVAGQKSEIARLQSGAEGLTNQVAEYQKAVRILEAKLKEAYGGINKQNEAMHEHIAQWDEFVKKYNDRVIERNKVVAKYNELAIQVEKMQSGAKK